MHHKTTRQKNAGIKSPVSRGSERSKEKNTLRRIITGSNIFVDPDEEDLDFSDD